MWQRRAGPPGSRKLPPRHRAQGWLSSAADEEDAEQLKIYQEGEAVLSVRRWLQRRPTLTEDQHIERRMDPQQPDGGGR